MGEKRARWIEDFEFKTASGINGIPCPGKKNGIGVPDYGKLRRMAESLCPYKDDE